MAGDLDGDGLAELAIGTTQTDDYRKFDPALVGRVSFLFSGGALSVGAGDLDLSTVDLTILGEPDGDYFGEQMMSGGDLDGDGRDDLVFTAPRDTRGGLESGAVFVMTTLGSLDLSQEQLWAEDADLGDQPPGQYLPERGASGLILEDQDADGLGRAPGEPPRWNTNGKVEGMAALIRGLTVSDASY
ncbi:MAG: FG-GAP repeat protein [Deltaproteobacteria bacterium]|nr:FG-GAP repeat protein [Deltaproteobacteria bacterium]